MSVFDMGKNLGLTANSSEEMMNAIVAKHMRDLDAVARQSFLEHWNSLPPVPPSIQPRPIGSTQYDYGDCDIGYTVGPTLEQVQKLKVVPDEPESRKIEL